MVTVRRSPRCGYLSGAVPHDVEPSRAEPQGVLPTQRPNEPMHLVLRSTGLKVHGEGEWRVRKHGRSKRRTWRKGHPAIDANTGRICAALMIHQDEGDGEVLPELLDQIPPLTRQSIPSVAMAPTTPRRAMLRLRRTELFRRSRRARARRRGQAARPARLGAMLPSTQSQKAAGENGSRRVATTGARWPRL
ncbi:hypothetical protein LMG24235_08523 [Paraburkholderia sabiae]|nr:hypothetical protein LMG24235_08523 [Paraburkholderia sabiae]